MNANGTEEPKAREVLLRATARAGMQENDPLYAVVMAQAELFENVMKGLSRPNHAEDMEGARAEIIQLAQIVRGMGESCAKMERRFTLVNNTLTKIEERVKALDQTTTTFAGVAKAQLWWLVGLVFMTGVMFWPAASVAIDWIRSTFHF